MIAATESALAKFPGALVSTDFVRLVGGIVKGQGITDNGNVLFAHSICVDEVNHEVVSAQSRSVRAIFGWA